MNKFIGYFAFSVFLLSLIAHLLTFVSVVPIAMSMVWPLHIGAMLSFVPMVFSAQRFQKKNAELFSGRDIRKFFTPFISARLSVLCTCAFLYAMFNFAMMLYHLPEGGPHFENGRYEIRSHGRTSRVITKQEYEQLQAYEVRGFSGHWILFSLFPTIFFLKVVPAIEEKEKKPS